MCGLALALDEMGDAAAALALHRQHLEGAPHACRPHAGSTLGFRQHLEGRPTPRRLGVGWG